MADCQFCGKPAGFFRSVHQECKSANESGRAEILSLVQKCLADGAALSSLKTKSEQIAQTHYIASSDITALVIQGWSNAVDSALADGVLSEQEESNLVELQKSFGLTQQTLDKNGAFTRVVKGTVLRELMNGKLPEKVKVVGSLPFNFQKGERLVWIFENVQYFEQRTHRHYEGRSSGVSIRIAKGLYYRTGAFRGHPVETTSSVLVGTGLLAFTSKHLYFSGNAKSFRVPYSKIVTYEPYSDGIGIQRDAASAKPQTFLTGDGWFTYNLAMNLSQL